MLTSAKSQGQIHNIWYALVPQYDMRWHPTKKVHISAKYMDMRWYDTKKVHISAKYMDMRRYPTKKVHISANYMICAGTPMYYTTLLFKKNGSNIPKLKIGSESLMLGEQRRVRKRRQIQLKAEGRKRLYKRYCFRSFTPLWNPKYEKSVWHVQSVPLTKV